MLFFQSNVLALNLLHSPVKFFILIFKLFNNALYFISLWFEWEDFVFLLHWEFQNLWSQCLHLQVLALQINLQLMVLDCHFDQLLLVWFVVFMQVVKVILQLLHLFKMVFVHYDFFLNSAQVIIGSWDLFTVFRQHRHDPMLVFRVKVMRVVNFHLLSSVVSAIETACVCSEIELDFWRKAVILPAHEGVDRAKKILLLFFMRLIFDVRYFKTFHSVMELFISVTSKT